MIRVQIATDKKELTGSAHEVATSDEHRDLFGDEQDPVETLSLIDSEATTDDDYSLAATPLDSPPNTWVSVTVATL